MFRWHVIFHERLYQEHYATLQKDDIKKYIQFVGVNELYTKTIPADIPKDCIVYEKDFPGYNPLYQMNRYYESSVMFHLYKHPELLSDIEFVGFCQYDMNFSLESMNQIKNVKMENYETTVVCNSYQHPQLLFSNPLHQDEWTQIIEHFNVFHSTKHTLNDILKHPFVFYHSFGMSKSNFLTMMKWIDAVQPLMLRLLKFDKRHLCGTIERFYGIYITLHTIMGTFQHHVVLKGMDHLNEKKFQDPTKSFLIAPEPSTPEPVKILKKVSTPQRVLQILLVGHGNMPIPPNGWGAVESLIYEYYCQLTSLGHVVTILNISNPAKIYEHLTTFQYDYVHFHNDILINLVKKLPTTMNIVFTSHYPYIHDKTQWNDSKSGYDYERLIMNPLLEALKTHRHLHICAVSEKDANAFQSYGVSRESITVTLNGVNSERFRIEESELKHPMKTICLAQIMKRKRQDLFRDIPSIVCVGKVNDPAYVPSPKQYLGTWTDIEKYETLTEYGNAILLSDGENGTPLSIKESLVAGLGVVVSDAVAYELPSDWFWVTRIPESSIHDKEHIRTVCESNRLVSLALRQIIRQKAKDAWDWSILVPRYLNSITNIFKLNV